MFEPLDDAPAAPFLGRFLGDGIGAAKPLGDRDEPLGRRFIWIACRAVEDHVLARFAQLGIDRVIDV